MELNGKKRQEIGKTVKNLRREGLIPAVVFGNAIESTAVVVNSIEFGKVFAQAGETHLVDLNLEDANYKVLTKDLQFDPISGKVIHVSFYKPNLSEKTEVEIPVELVGEETNPLVKSGEGVVLQLMNQILVKALPADLPDHFEIDVSTLTEMGAGVTIGELNYDRSKVEIVDYEDDELVVKIDSAKMAEEVAEEVDEAAAIENLEATKEKKAEEEEEAAETKKK